MSELRTVLERYLDENLAQMVVSNPCSSEGILKVRLRPLLLKGELVFQAEEQKGSQAFHKNLNGDQVVPYLEGLLNGILRQLEVSSAKGTMTVLVSKKGKVTIKEKPSLLQGTQDPVKMEAMPRNLAHNREKRYILEEGKAVPFLVDLGVMTAEGAIVRTRYDKFRQINRFLEFIEDILPKLNKTRENTILDFGCGKSYLTFAMYYYLNVLKGYPVRIIGLDLKQDVIARCSRLSEAYGFEHLTFQCGDIAGFERTGEVDMVVTLHACDTATDYALAKAVEWGAKVILSVPCCQHELNRQIQNPILDSVFQYGLIKERTAALFTDGIRAEILEYSGYRTQILEFIDMDHTPKNILIRAVKTGEKKANEPALTELMEFLRVKPVLWDLLKSQPR